MYGKKLKEIRNSLKLTQEAFAKELNISTRTYTSYERSENKPSYFMLETLGKTFNVNLNWFIFDYGEMFNNSNFEQAQGELALEVRKILREEGLIK